MKIIIYQRCTWLLLSVSRTGWVDSDDVTWGDVEVVFPQTRTKHRNLSKMHEGNQTLLLLLYKTLRKRGTINTWKKTS